MAESCNASPVGSHLARAFLAAVSGAPDERSSAMRLPEPTIRPVARIRKIPASSSAASAIASRSAR